MPIDRAWITRNIPHHGRMCLLDEVVFWDPDRIRCSSASHASPANPLRARGQLGIACGIEYAAQAIAVHGALLAAAVAGQTPAAGAEAAARSSRAAPSPPAAGSHEKRPAPGFLVALRGVEFHALRLHDVPGQLMCDAVKVAGDGGTAIYEFAVGSAGKRLLDGRATVILQAGEWMP